MSENTSKNNNVRDDEIDLLDLFRRMGRGLKRFGIALSRAFLISFVFITRRWLPLGLSIILGIVASVLLVKTSHSYYTSDLVLKINIKPTDEVITYINRLHTFCLDANKSHLSEAISLRSGQTDNIMDIQAFWIIDNGNDKIPDYVDYEGNHNVYDTTNVRMEDRLDIRVRIMQPQELSNVRDGIVKFISNFSLFQQRNNLRLNQNNEMLARLNYDIVQLDSLQKFKYFEETKNMVPKTGNQMVFLQEQKTQLVYKDIYDLYKKKQELELDCNLYKDISTVLSDFTIPSARDNSGSFYAKKLVPLFFIITLLLLILIANRGKFRELYKKY